MLLAVEGGGFFSSSASGYSKGLALLLLGQRSEDKSMRVSPLSQYQLVDQKSGTNIQLASAKNRISRGCASLVCFGRASAGLDGQPSFKIGPTQPQGDVAVDGDKESIESAGNENNFRNVSLKSSMKKRSHSVPTPIEDGHEWETVDEQHSDNLGLPERRKVQWTDACGRELAEIREFELSDTGDSDDEFEYGSRKICSCRIIRRMQLVELRRKLSDLHWIRRR